MMTVGEKEETSQEEDDKVMRVRCLERETDDKEDDDNGDDSSGSERDKGKDSPNRCLRCRAADDALTSLSDTLSCVRMREGVLSTLLVFYVFVVVRSSDVS